MADPEEPTFLGFGLFETTVFFTSILVACYSLISNPTGRRSARDRSEHQVFSEWRLGMLCIMVQLEVIVSVILAYTNAVPGNSVSWLAALMLAPWAPLAGKVSFSLRSGASVRRMMLSRVTRNELCAVIRDRFCFGHRGNSLARVIDHFFPGTRTGNSKAQEALRGNEDYRGLEEEVALHAKRVVQTGGKRIALELDVLCPANFSRQPTSISHRSVSFERLTRPLDILLRCWTQKSHQLTVDYMPEIKDLSRRALVLDIVDELQEGGTISDSLMERKIWGRFCARCTLAMQAAVETFLESSALGHIGGLQEAIWLGGELGHSLEWSANFTDVINIMCEACFMENKGVKIEARFAQKSRLGNGHGDTYMLEDTNRLNQKVFAFLFCIARSLVAADSELESFRDVLSVLKTGPDTKSWWARYWEDPGLLSSLVSKRDERMLHGRELDSSAYVGSQSVFEIALTKQIRSDIAAIGKEDPGLWKRMSTCQSGEECFLQPESATQEHSADQGSTVTLAEA